jgi:hypothetical protein
MIVPIAAADCPVSIKLARVSLKLAVASQERCKWLWAQVLGEVRRRL